MSREFRRLRDRADRLEEQLDQIRGAVALVEIEGLADAIDDSEKGQRLRLVLVNIEKIVGGTR